MVENCECRRRAGVFEDRIRRTYRGDSTRAVWCQRQLQAHQQPTTVDIRRVDVTAMRLYYALHDGQSQSVTVRARCIAATEQRAEQRSDFCLGCLTGRYPSAPVVAMPGADRQPALKL